MHACPILLKKGNGVDKILHQPVHLAAIEMLRLFKFYRLSTIAWLYLNTHVSVQVASYGGKL